MTFLFNKPTIVCAGGEAIDPSRRRVLTQLVQLGRVGAAASLACGLGLAASPSWGQPLVGASAPAERPRLTRQAGPAIPKWPEPDEVRQIWLKRQRTNEVIVSRYYDGRQLNWEQYVACCTMLRDVQSGTVARIDIGLLDLIFAIQKWLVEWGIDRPLIVHSGYRAQSTNSREGGALNSMHLQGRALDFSVQGIPADYLGRLARIFSVGGVGFYMNRGFTHIDTGRVRQWVQ